MCLQPIDEMCLQPQLAMPNSLKVCFAPIPEYFTAKKISNMVLNYHYKMAMLIYDVHNFCYTYSDKYEIGTYNIHDVEIKQPQLLSLYELYDLYDQVGYIKG